MSLADLAAGRKPPEVDFCPALRHVLAEHPICRAILRHETPSTRNRAILAPSTMQRGRPSVFPLARAFRSPAAARGLYWHSTNTQTDLLRKNCLAGLV